MVRDGEPHLDVHTGWERAEPDERRISGTATRFDIHKVVVALALPKAINREVGPTRDLVFSFVIASGRTTSERLAAEAADQAIKRELFRSAIFFNQ